MIPLHEIFRIVHIIETESRIVVTKSWRQGRMSDQCLMGTEFQLGKMEQVLEVDGGYGCSTI